MLELTGRELDRGIDILDVGCGGGWLLAELSIRGIAPGRLHGIDLIPQRVAAARSRVPRADISRADARSLPFEAGRFGLVTMLTALSSMPKDAVEPALHEAKRVVADSGIVICYEPRIANPFNRATATISSEVLARTLGPAKASVRLTGFPPAARRLGRHTDRLYPPLARFAPTHRLTAH